MLQILLGDAHMFPESGTLSAMVAVILMQFHGELFQELTGYPIHLHVFLLDGRKTSGLAEVSCLSRTVIPLNETKLNK